MEWSNVFSGMFTASFLWFLIPIFMREPPQHPRPWLHWFARLPPIIQLLCNGVLAGTAAAMTRLLFRVVQGGSLSLAPLLYALGWLLGTLVVGGWQLWRGRFPILRVEEEPAR